MHGSYPSRANGAQSWTAKCRAFYEERKRQRVEAVDVAHAVEIVDLLRQVHGRAKAVNTEGVRVLVKKCRERFPVEAPPSGRWHIMRLAHRRLQSGRHGRFQG